MICSYPKCTDVATHAPKICVPDVEMARETPQPMSILIGMKLCLMHASTFDVQETLNAPQTPEMRDLFTCMAQSQGLMPDFNRAYVVPIALTSDAVVQMEEMRAQRDATAH
jgi:hypothetical protein